MQLQIRRFLIFFSLSCIAFTAQAKQQTVTMQQSLQKKLWEYGPASDRTFRSAFHHAKLTYPPKQLALLIFKKDRKLEVYARNKRAWHYIKSFHIYAASGVSGPKLRSGDRQVPEGVYRIIGLNPNSRFDLSMHLNYPNAFDRQEARYDHRQHLGGDIFIHGSNRSIGCVAIGDAGIEKLFPLVAKVGTSDVKVIIAPDDMRRESIRSSYVHPRWTPQLYRRIRLALRAFPEKV